MRVLPWVFFCVGHSAWVRFDTDQPGDQPDSGGLRPGVFSVAELPLPCVEPDKAASARKTGAELAEHIGIIGAGLAGATAARLLTRAGARVTILEKSGGTGGRLSTRRTEFGPFDHGAQFITARGDAFADTIYRLTAEGGAHEWRPSGKDREDSWHVGLPGMSGFVKPLLGGQDVRLRCRVKAIEPGSGCIDVRVDNGDVARFDRVVVTAPAPQSYALLGGLDIGFTKIADAVMAPCWAGMLSYPGRLEAIPDILRGSDEAALGWVARDSSKHGRESVENIVVHAGAAWSARHLEDEAEAVVEMMAGALAEIAGDAALARAFGAAHRWRHARVDKALEVPFLAGCDDRVFACGDWCIGGRAEAAFESGRLAAQHLIEQRLA
jgi:renalase